MTVVVWGAFPELLSSFDLPKRRPSPGKSGPISTVGDAPLSFGSSAADAGANVEVTSRNEKVTASIFCLSTSITKSYRTHILNIELIISYLIIRGRNARFGDGPRVGGLAVADVARRGVPTAEKMVSSRARRYSEV
ncbi:hypothetical protein NGM10_11135 [Halorussus salilacus]|uniref:hypothetical protein n=1 Tax=Halorussus salilacus TaxID=2953750 RepID=UPI00209F49E2|nr:hypothetical protein [Halorussus salilacus]USZ67283.1 hypothetical protein NGM10_11135 [Halorussus salilacus]